MSEYRTTIPKDDTYEKAPCWWDQAGGIFMRCGNGHISRLADHSIDDDGQVSPSVVCPTCDWHEWVTLGQWMRGPPEADDDD